MKLVCEQGPTTATTKPSQSNTSPRAVLAEGMPVDVDVESGMCVCVCVGGWHYLDFLQRHHIVFNCIGCWGRGWAVDAMDVGVIESEECRGIGNAGW